LNKATDKTSAVMNRF